MVAVVVMVQVAAAVKIVLVVVVIQTLSSEGRSVNCRMMMSHTTRSSLV